MIRPSKPLIVSAAVLLALMAVVMVALAMRRDSNGLATHPDAVATPLAGRAATAVPRPASRRPPGADFVGSQKCAECHEEIAQRYDSHTMSRAIAQVPDDRGIEAVEEAVIRPGGICVYKVKKDDRGWWHCEAAVDAEGKTIYEQWEQVHYAIGSGIRGRTYVIDRGGLLFESPISWFTGAQKWDLSPGYIADDDRRFDRRITDDCVACHSGRVRDLRESHKRFGQPLIIEAAIGCERCHGPGRRHVAYQESDTQEGPDPILNPAQLDADRQNAICYQCHMVGAARIARYGMDVWEFQPGDRLEDVFITFVHTSNTVDNPTKAVSQATQMQASRCFVESGRKLLCTTCHDAHSIPPEAEKPLWYRSKCLECHQEDSCELEIDARRKVHSNDACTECHMPQVSETDVAHTVQTDHRIVRRPGVPPPPPPWTSRFGLSFFDGCDKGLPEWEYKRTLGLAMDFDLDIDYKPVRAEEMERLLQAALRYVPDDADVLLTLARAAMRRNAPEEALKYYVQGAKHHPKHEDFLGGAGTVYYQLGQPDKALPYLQRLIRVNPWDASAFAVQADVLRQLGRMDDGIASAEKALRLNPRYPDVRRWLVEAYRQTGQSAKASEQQDIIRRLTRQ